MDITLPNRWWHSISPQLRQRVAQIWIPAANPGYAGLRKFDRMASLDKAFGADCWRERHIVRGRIVSTEEALREYEQSYRFYLYNHPPLVDFLVECCGNVYDDNIENTRDAAFEQPHTGRNHYQDIVIRRIVSEMVDDPEWPMVTETELRETDLIDLSSGRSHCCPVARGFRGKYLLQVRGPQSPGFCLSPAVIPVYDPSLLATNPKSQEWYLDEGCGYLSVEAFWQTSKIIEVRYDKFLEKKDKIEEIFRSLP